MSKPIHQNDMRLGKNSMPKATCPEKATCAVGRVMLSRQPKKSRRDGCRATAATAPEAEQQGGAVTHEFRSEKWVELYSKRIDDVIAVLKSKRVPVFWVGLPPKVDDKTVGVVRRKMESTSEIPKLERTVGADGALMSFREPLFAIYDGQTALGYVF